MSESTSRGPSARRWGEAAPWIVSVAAHTAVLAAGFFIVWTALPEPRGEVRGTVISFGMPSTPPKPDRPDAATPESDQRPAPAPAPIEIADTPTIAEALASPSLSTDSETAPRLQVDAPSLADVAPATAVKFFGVGATNVRSVVYVVDASGSMITTFPFILDELERSAGALDPLQRFQVIFFRGDADGRPGRVAAPDPAKPDRTRETRLIRCTPQNVRSVLEWTRSIRPSGRSNPLEALRVAINLHPDAILMLSSSIAGTGQWEVSAEKVLGELDALNPVSARTGRRPITIMTVQMIEEDPSGLLKAIGEAHGPPGTGYRYISRNELQK